MDPHGSLRKTAGPVLNSPKNHTICQVCCCTLQKSHFFDHQILKQWQKTVRAERNMEYFHLARCHANRNIHNNCYEMCQLHQSCQIKNQTNKFLFKSRIKLKICTVNSVQHIDNTPAVYTELQFNTLAAPTLEDTCICP